MSGFPPEPQPRTPRRSLFFWCAAAGLLLLALAPWWRNHAYLRNFYDYSIMVAGAARIEAGERPYVDFTTPFQSGGFVMNLAAERLFGGGYLGMTRGAAAMIGVSLAGMVWLLLRRWPPAAALAVGAALVVTTVTQHTIIWYNAVGTLCLAIVACGAAIAPVLRRDHLGWHVAVLAALLIGGVNKLNYQVLSVAVAAAWALRAGLIREARWPRVAATIAGLVIAGIVAPPLLEMLWTGASWKIWWHNTVGLAAGNRAEDLRAALTLGYYLKPQHDYYGALVLPQVGLVGVVLTLWTVALAMHRAWRERRGHDRWLPLPAGLLAVGGGVGLLSTNYEIAYVALAGWIVLLIALWFGFGLSARGARFWAGFVVPVALVGAVGWHSAWLGQRSQFGYSMAAREEYRRADEAGPEFAYLRGTLVPPELFESFRVLREVRAGFAPGESVFYGPGLEYLERIWPGTKLAPLPLSIHWGATTGPREAEMLARQLDRGALSRVWVSLPQDTWRGMPAAVLQQRHESHLLGPVVVQYLRGTGLARPVDFIRSFGGNVDARLLDVGKFEIFEDTDQRLFLGVSSSWVSGRIGIPTHRIEYETILRRAPGASLDEPLTAHFTVYGETESDQRVVLWVGEMTLPPGLVEARQVHAMAGQRTLILETDVPEEYAGKLRAGWGGFRITHVTADPASPAWVGTQKEIPPLAVTAEERTRLFPDNAHPAEMLLRGGRVTASGVELDASGELWIRVEGQLREFRAQVRGGGAAFGDTAALRCFWYKGGRLDLYDDEPLAHGNRLIELHAWGGEPGGWVVIVNDIERHGAPVQIEFTRWQVE